MEHENRIKMCHTNRGQVQDENKLQKQVKNTKRSNSAKKQKSSTLTVKSVAKNTVYKALFQNRYWIWIAWIENRHINLLFFQFQAYSKVCETRVYHREFHTCKQRNWAHPEKLKPLLRHQHCPNQAGSKPPRSFQQEWLVKCTQSHCCFFIISQELAQLQLKRTLAQANFIWRRDFKQRH